MQVGRGLGKVTVIKEAEDGKLVQQQCLVIDEVCVTALDPRSCSRLPSCLLVQDAPPTPHDFKSHTYKTPHYCAVCRTLLWGAVKQGYRCSVCKCDVHRGCQLKAHQHCPCSAE